ncbi:hypothetical protein TNCV_4270251 [Trichonephila clavipes]|nr:hypothetical protein TNCV_4270251 [Trichonephila clavipes]
MVDLRPSTPPPLMILECATAQCRRCGEAVTQKCLGDPLVDRDRRNAYLGNRCWQSLKSESVRVVRLGQRYSTFIPAGPHTYNRYFTWTATCG